MWTVPEDSLIGELLHYFTKFSKYFEVKNVNLNGTSGNGVWGTKWVMGHKTCRILNSQDVHEYKNLLVMLPT
jgi:hypothetical protein